MEESLSEHLPDCSPQPWLDGENTVWTLEPEIGNVVVDHMDFRTHDGFFVVGTHGQGIFSTHLQTGFAGIDEQHEDISVYPTLVKTFVQVETPNSASTIEIYSVGGQRVYQQSINQSIESINLSAFRAGTYVLVVKSEDRFWSKKIVKH
jgi:hypothetical protein